MEGTIAFLAFVTSAILFCIKAVPDRFAFAALAVGFAFSLASLPT